MRVPMKQENEQVGGGAVAWLPLEKNQREARQPIGSFSRDSDSEQVRAAAAVLAMQESEG